MTPGALAIASHQENQNMRPFKQVVLAYIGISLATMAGTLLSGCGDAGYDGADEVDSLGDELAELEQGLSAKTTPNFQYGTSTGSTKLRCNKTTPGQACAIPPKKAGISVCIDTIHASGTGTVFTAAETSRIAAFVNAVDARTGWDFDIDNVGGTPVCDAQNRSPQADLTFVVASVGSSGSASNDIANYGMPFFSGLTGLSEGAGVVGQYQKWTTCTARVDIVDAYAKGANATEDAKFVDHAAAHGLAGCVGIGGRSGNNGRASDTVMNSGNSHTGYSAGENCVLDSFSAASPTTFENVGTCGSD